MPQRSRAGGGGTNGKTPAKKPTSSAPPPNLAKLLTPKTPIATHGPFKPPVRLPALPPERTPPRIRDRTATAPTRTPAALPARKPTNGREVPPSAFGANGQTKDGKAFFEGLKPNSPLFSSTSRVNLANPAGQARVASRIVPAVTPSQIEGYKPPLAPDHHGGSSFLGSIGSGLRGAEHAAAGAVKGVVEHPIGAVKGVQQAYDARLRSGKTIGPGASTADAIAGANKLTTKGLAKLAQAQGIQSPAQLEGAASTNAGILDGAKGIPLANMTADAREKIGAALAFFVKHPNFKYKVPNLGYWSADQKKKLGLPPTATDGDVQRKYASQYSKVIGHPGFADKLFRAATQNLAQLAASPVGVAYLASETGQGHTGAAAEFAREQVQFGKDLIHHPLKTFEEQPVSVLTAGFGVTRAAGGLAGAAARSEGLGALAAKAGGERGAAAAARLKGFATPAPRDVSPAGFATHDVNGVETPAPTIRRGETSPNLDERAAQKLSDWAASHVDRGGFGRRVTKGLARTITRDANRALGEYRRENVQPAMQATAKLSRAERQAAVFAHGQGIKPSRMLAAAVREAENHRGLEQSAKGAVHETGANEHAIWQRTQNDLDNAVQHWTNVVNKAGDEITKPMAEAIAKSTHASRQAERVMAGQRRIGSSAPLISEHTYLRRAYVPQIAVRASEGDATAIEFMQLDHEATVLAEKLKTATPERADKIEHQLRTLHAEQGEQLDRLLGKVNSRIDQARTLKLPEQAHEGTMDPAVSAQIHELQVNRAVAAEKLGQIEHEIAKGGQLKAKRIAPGEKPRLATPPAELAKLHTKRDKLAALVEQIDAHVDGLVADDRALRAMPKDPALSAMGMDAGPALMPMQKPRLNMMPSEIARLEARRAALEDLQQQHAAGELSTAKRGGLESQLEAARAEHPDVLASTLDQAQREADARLTAMRNEYRGTRNAEPVAPNAPLDLSDPLYFPHTIKDSATAKTLRRVGLGSTSPDVVPKYRGRLGSADGPTTGRLMLSGRVDTDPRVFFQAAAMPARVAQVLEHLQRQIGSFTVDATPGMQYNRTRWKLLRVSGNGHEHPATANARPLHNLEDSIAAGAEGGGWFGSLMDHFQDGERASVAFDRVPRDGEFKLVSQDAFNQLRNEGSGAIVSSGVGKFAKNTTQAWRFLTLLARPAWAINNAVGNIGLAALAGAGPVSFTRALMPKYRELIPKNAENTGQFRNLFTEGDSVTGKVSGVAHKITAPVEKTNIATENWARRAAYLRHAIPKAKREQAGRLGITRVSDDVIATLQRYKTLEEAAPHLVTKINGFLFDFTKGKNTPVLDVVAPFHKWFEAITKLTVTMPAKTPGRALLLQRLGQFGINVQNQAFGGFVPNSMQGALQLPASLPYVGDLFVRTQPLNPLATDFQLTAPNDQSTTNPGHPGFGGFAGMFNPGVETIYAWGSGKNLALGGDLKDANNNAVGPFNTRVLLNQLENATPLGPLISGYNAADTSLNPFSPQRRRPTIGTQPQANFLERLSGYAGLGIKPYAPQLNAWSSGNRLNNSIKAQIKNEYKHRSK